MNADHERSQDLRARLADRAGLLGRVVLYHPKTQTMFRRYFFYATSNLYNLVEDPSCSKSERSRLDREYMQLVGDKAREMMKVHEDMIGLISANQVPIKPTKGTPFDVVLSCPFDSAYLGLIELIDKICTMADALREAGQLQHSKPASYVRFLKPAKAIHLKVCEDVQKAKDARLSKRGQAKPAHVGAQFTATN